MKNKRRSKTTAATGLKKSMEDQLHKQQRLITKIGKYSFKIGHQFWASLGV